ncbi:MAG: branched-chain amino acid ABC transporter permease [Spirochaetales bacterium]|nr:branched-chain amino acid ABC transporter permease [Spirochaetales bacterium]MCF7938446.1 branched-chain amino acid ABC transporter permease [Spirochaetales bacterium]
MYYFLAVTAIYILLSWSIYLPYRVMHLHFMSVANMTISGYLGAYAALSWGWPFMLVLVVGIVVGAFVGWITSFAIGDAPTFAVVIVGFTYIYISKTVVENTDALGGTLGLFNIPSIHSDPSTSKLLLLIIVYLFVILMGFLIHRFENSRLGRAASAIFVDHQLAKSFGINVKRTGMFLQTWSSAMGGASGVLYAYLMRNLFPDFFTFHLIGIAMTMLFVGGYATMWGGLLAAPLLWGGPLLFPPEIASWRIVIYGTILVVMLVLKPEGLITRPLVYRIESYFRRRRDRRIPS